MSGEPDVRAELDRDIGIVGAVALGVGTMIAAGIFVLSGLAVSTVGAMAIVAFLVAAVVASFTAFAYAEFAAIYPESGGGYAYVANTFDTDLTYIVGWSMILGYPASAAFYLASFSDWFVRFVLPLFDPGALVPYWAPGIVVLASLVGLNLKGTEESGRFQILVTALKVLLIGLFLFGGLQAFDGGTLAESFGENLTRFRDVGLTSALVFITFFGFEAIATNAEEIEEPGRTVPRAIFVSMGFVTVVYALVVVVVVLAVNDPRFVETFLPANADLGGLSAEAFVAQNGEIAMGYAASYYLGDVGFYVIIVGALFSMLSAANATILAGSRVKLAMSRRDHLPTHFEALHPTFNTPYFAVLLTGGFILLFVLLFTVVFGGGPGTEAMLPLPVSLPVVGAELHLGVEAIAHFADFMLLSGLVVVNLALVQSRRKFPDIERTFEVPGVPYVPAVAVLANLVLLVNVEPGAFLVGLVAELVGVAFYLGVLAGGPSEERMEDVAPTVLRETEPSDAGYRLLVPVANPDTVPQLMRTARDIVRERDGEILVVSVVTLPDQTPLSEGHEYARRRRAVLDEAIAYGRGATADGGTSAADDRDAGDRPDDTVPVSGLVRIGHHAGEAIVHTVAQHDVDAVLMGWRGRTARRRDIVLGSVVDVVVAEADCDVLVERIGGEERPDSVLVPTAGGPHADLAVEVAGAIARANGATVEVVTVVPPDADARTRERARSVLDGAAARFEGAAVRTTLLEEVDIAGAIVARSADHDLTVVGATRESLLQRLLFGDVPHEVGERAAGTVIMAKRNLGITSRVRKLFDRFGHL